MSEVNINDSSIKRFVITCHKFDPETNHFRWMPEIAFDQKRDWNRYWDRWVADLELRSQMGTSHSKEAISGYILDVGDVKESISDNKTSAKFQHILPKLFRQKRFLPNYESAWTEYKALYPEG
ncbi:MAG: hypothetical protein D4R69_05855 [Actinomycetales bacterium]|nr:MAG: hypothetical protein D4R69_05855 [Actinomycetales bacterium]